MLKIIKVTGNSLSPFFLPGDYVIINTCRQGYKKLQPGTVVVFHHPEYGRLIKRVHTNNPVSEILTVTGSHENSISSHKLGPIPYKNLIGKVIFHIKKPRAAA